MSENKQLLAKHEENDSIIGQFDAHPVGTGIGNGLAKAAIGGKERIIKSETPQFLDKHEENVYPITDQPNAHLVGTGMGNGLAKAAIGAVVGAVVGTLAGALANKKTTESINHTFKGVGDAVKGASEGVNDTFKRAVDAVKGVPEGVKPSVKGTVEDAKPSGNQDVNPSDNQSFKLYEERLVADKKQVKTAEVVIGKHVETQTAYISVPVDKERLVVEQTPVDAVTPAAPGEADFHEGEIARMEIYEETAGIQKQAFVREEVSVRKEVEHDTVEIEDKIRREELDIDTQGRNVIDKTKTL